MAYDYKEERHRLFTEENQKLFLAIRDKANALLNAAGSFRMQEVWAGRTGTTWEMMACVDRLVELGEIHEVIPAQPYMGQYRIFTRFPTS